MFEKRQAIAFGFLILLPLAGCAKKLPPIIPTEGIVLLDGKPLAKASVTFIPQLEDFGAESNSTAVTDEKGHFVLTCQFNNQPGAVAGQHIVLVTEGPLPEKMRNSQDSRAVDSYWAGLGNRPIPAQYSSVSKSPLKLEIKPGQDSLTVELTR